MIDGDARPAWLNRLLGQPTLYDPFVVIDLLERLRPTAKRVGGDGSASDEGLRLRHSRSLTFKPGDLEHVDLPADPDGRIEVTVNVVGLTGTSSPLPTYLASEAAADDEAGVATAEFLDLFHHRLLSLLYRSIRKFDWPSEFSIDGDDPWSRRVLALLGLDTYDRTPLRHLRALDLLRIAPLLAGPARTARTLELALAEILAEQLADATVSVAQFRGSWVAVDPEHEIRLGVLNSKLGVDALLGDTCLDRGAKTQIVIGPLDQAGLRRFAVGAPGHCIVRELLEMLDDGLIEFELELVIGSESRTHAILGLSRLSDDAWLASADPSSAATEARMIVALAREHG